MVDSLVPIERSQGDKNLEFHLFMHRQELESHDFFQDSGDERTDKELSVCFLCWTFG